MVMIIIIISGHKTGGRGWGKGRWLILLMAPLLNLLSVAIIRLHAVTD